MRGFYLFVSGALVGLLIQTAVAQVGAQNQNPGVNQLNHVGIAVEDLDAAVTFYTETMGFQESFRVTNDAGQVGLVYLRVSDDTFVEIQSANENRPVGISHFGIHVADRDDAMAMFSGRGATPTNTRIGLTEAVIADIFDPDGIRIEISEYPAASLQGKALAGEL